MRVDADRLIEEFEQSRSQNLSVLAKKFANTNDANERDLIYWEITEFRQDKTLTERDDFFRTVCKLPDSPEKTVLMGMAYEFGIGPDEDLNYAYELYLKAADQGQIIAKCIKGYMCWHGKGIAKNRDLSEKLFREACTAGNPTAQNIFGHLLYSSREEEAERLLDQAAQRNFPPAKRNFGYHLYQKHKSNSTALMLLQEAIKGGDSSALNRLAFLLDNGDTVEKDCAQARKLFEKAATMLEYSAGLHNFSAILKRDDPKDPMADVLTKLAGVVDEEERLFYPEDSRAIQFVIEHCISVRRESRFLAIATLNDDNKRAISDYIQAKRKSDTLTPTLRHAESLIDSLDPPVSSPLLFWGLRCRRQSACKAEEEEVAAPITYTRSKCD